MKTIENLTPIKNAETTITFKNAKLQRATNQISKIFADAQGYAEAKNRQLASILATVKVEKLYEEDGFKSVAEYAEKTFGIKRANAYALSSAGEIYNDDKASAKMKELSPSKLFEVANVDREKLEKDIEEGVISDKTTQAELRDYAKAAKTVDDAPAKVVDTYRAWPVVHQINDALADFCNRHLTMDEWKVEFTKWYGENAGLAPEAWTDVSMVKLPSNGNKEVTRYLIEVPLTANYMIVSFAKYVPEKQKAKKSKKSSNKTSLTMEQMKDLLMAQPGATPESVQTALSAIYGIQQK